MSRKMLINVLHPEEARVAIVQDGRLMELNIEISGKEQTKGNIYKGVVLRVEPGLQAAFVDIGQGKPGFLQMGELHPEFWQWRDDVSEEDRKRRPRIQDVLRRGQELIVQVEKDGRDHKGAALTSYVSLPGRYMVLMPGSDSAGISRKIEGDAIRKELKKLVAEMNVPEGYGYIVRTEALGRTPEELSKDLEYLIGTYQKVRQRGDQVKGPKELYQDAGIILRTIRDYFSEDIDEVLVDDKTAYTQAREFFQEIMPGYEQRVKLHQEKRPIFAKYQLEEQIDQLYEKKVLLPSGGSLVIEPTEALVSIDVNSGKSSGEKGVEDTAFKTNLEAAAEVARQLRLRDLGGLVVIDFIDMRDNKHNKEVERCLKDALKADKARVNIGRISQFGMLEMSRQRIAKNINDAIHLECPHCEGRGKVKSVESMALSFLRKVHAAAAKGQVSEVLGGLPLEVAYFLLNRKKRELTQIENDYEIIVTVKGKPSFLLNQLELEVVRKEKPVQSAEDAEIPAVAPAHLASGSADESGVEAGGKKKRRRRKKKKSGSNEPLHDTASLDSSAEDAQDTVEEQQTASDADEQVDANDKPKKRRRPRARKKPAATQDPAVVEERSVQASTQEVAIAADAVVVADETPKSKKRPVRKKPGQKVAAAAEEPAGETDPKPKKRTSSKAKVKKPVVSEEAGEVTKKPEEISGQKAPAKRRTRGSNSKKQKEE
jgi:ribonuclease E